MTKPETILSLKEDEHKPGVRIALVKHLVKQVPVYKR